MNILFRAQEWLADRVSFIQYPNVRRVLPQRAMPRKLSLAEGVLVGVGSAIVLAVGAGMVIAGCFVLYVIVSSL